jgi:hypothetical protein
MIEVVTVDKRVGTPYQIESLGFVIVDNKLYIEAGAAADLAHAIRELMDWMQYPNLHMGESARDMVSRTLQDTVRRELDAVERSVTKGGDALESKLFDDAEGLEEAS